MSFEVFQQNNEKNSREGQIIDLLIERSFKEWSRGTLKNAIKWRIVKLTSNYGIDPDTAEKQIIKFIKKILIWKD